MKPTKDQDAMPLSGRNERNAKGQYLPGVSGNPGGEPGWIRKRFTADFLTAFHDHFQREGRRVIAKVAKQQPAAYLRCLTMLVPKEMKVEQTGGIKAMTDEPIPIVFAILADPIGGGFAASIAHPGKWAKVIKFAGAKIN